MKNGQDLEGLSVLIVENEFLLAINLEAVMREGGATTVNMAANLTDAKALIGDTDHDVAILDVRLTDGDSLPLAADLIDRGVPVVIHSGHANLEHSQIVPEAVFLPKPATPKEIIQAVLAARVVPGAFELSGHVSSNG